VCRWFDSGWYHTQQRPLSRGLSVFGRSSIVTNFGHRHPSSSMQLIDLAIPHLLLDTVPVIELSLNGPGQVEVRANKRLRELVRGSYESDLPLEVHATDLNETIAELRLMSRYPGSSAVARRFRLRAGDQAWVHVRGEFVLHKVSRVHLLAAAVVHDERPMRRMDQRLAQVAKGNQLLLDVAEVLSRHTADSISTLGSVARLVSLHFNVVCDILLIEPGSDLIIPVATGHPDKEIVAEIRRLYSLRNLRVGEGMLGKVMSTGEMFLNNQVAGPLPTSLEVDMRIWPKALLYLPLIGRGHTLGAMAFSRLLPDMPYSPAEVAEAQDIVNLTSIFIDANDAYRQLKHELEARVEAERKVTESDLRQRLVLWNVEDLITILSDDGVILYVNHPITGYEGVDFVGTRLLDHTPPEMVEERVRLMNEALATGRPFEQTRTATDQSGRSRWFVSKFCPIGKEGDKERLLVITREVTEHHEAEMRVLNAMVTGQEEERAALAAELHDGVGQVLTSIGLELSQLEQSCGTGNEAQHARLVSAMQKVTDAVQEVRNISHGLRPQVLEAFGLVIAVRDLCREMTGLSGINVSFDSAGVPDRLEREVEANLFRIAQELLTNVYRHSGAQRAHVNLIGDEEMITLTVEDDGRGLDPDGSVKGIGLRNMETRSRVLNGKVEVESTPGQGVFVTVSVPLRPILTER
jgi:PAS domain S-box-containing protein